MSHPGAWRVRAKHPAAPSRPRVISSAGSGAVSGRQQSRSKAAGFAVGRIGSLLIYVYGAQAPTDAVWAKAIAYYRAATVVTPVRVLVYSNGGAPGPRQRADFFRLANGTPVRIAVVAFSALARAAAAAFRWWLNDGLRLFNAAELESALDFLSVPRAEWAEVRLMLDSLKQDITGARPSI